MKYKASQYITSANLNNGDENNSQKIVFSTRSGQSVLLSNNLYTKLLNNDFDQIPIQIIEKMFKMEMIVPDTDNEFNSILNQDRVASTDTLNITIQPTANCQFGCHYCGQVHQKYNAPNDVTKLIVDRIRTKLLNDRSYKKLDVMWYGGEPLLAYSQLKSTSEALIKITNELDITYGASMITNGLSLKPEIFKDLYLNHNVRGFQITIDGTKEHHDTRRITKEGQGTFDIIMSNIKKIVSLPEYKKYKEKPILIRMNIDSTNFSSITKMIDLLAENGLADKVNLDYAPIVNWGDLKDGDTVGLNQKEFGMHEIEWIMYANSKGFEMPNLLPSRTYHPCMVTMKDAEVYDAFGNIYPCYEFPYTPVYETGEYLIGNLKDDEQNYNKNAKPRDWFDKVEEGKTSGCKTCKFFPVCAGGCPKQWYSGDSGCPSFKFNFEDRLILNYLQLQKNKVKSN